MRSLLLHSVLGLALVACGSSHRTPGGGDGGIGIDSGGRDAGPGIDGGPGVDSGPGVDAGPGPGLDAGPPGDVCTNAEPCTGGAICVGEGCGETWSCVFTAMPCTDDAAPHCGCDGVTFYDSSTCPTQPFAHRGECGAVVNCDARDVLCRALPPECPEGEVPAVEGSCWNGCVSIANCECSDADDCPMREIYTCHNSAGRCGPYL